MAEEYGRRPGGCGRPSGRSTGREPPLFADTPARKQFSQHANVLAVLAASRPATRRATWSRA